MGYLEAHYSQIYPYEEDKEMLVPFTELMNEKQLSLATNLSMALLKLFLTVPAAIAPRLILCIANFIDGRK